MSEFGQRVQAGLAVAPAPEVWNRLVDAVEGVRKLGVAPPLQMHDSGTGAKVISINLPLASCIPCRVQHNGGGLGSDSTTNAATYDIYLLNNTTKVNTTGGAITPKGPPRIPNVTYTAAEYGHYYMDADGTTYILFLYDEQPDDEHCVT